MVFDIIFLFFFKRNQTNNLQRKMGCPALLIYKNAELIGNFVRMGDEFGDEFCSSDVENFLLE